MKLYAFNSIIDKVPAIRELAAMLMKEQEAECEQISEILKENAHEYYNLKGMTPEQMEVYKRSHENDGLPKRKNRGHDTEDWQRHKAKQKRKRRNKKK